MIYYLVFGNNYNINSLNKTCLDIDIRTSMVAQTTKKNRLKIVQEHRKIEFCLAMKFK